MRPFTYPVMRILAWTTVRMRKGNKQHATEALALEWQKMFPGGKKTLPITEVKDDVAYAEIHFPCPLNGTGDGAACHRLMEYDRAMVKRLGGKFEVLESQAVTGKKYCKVAMRLAEKQPI